MNQNEERGGDIVVTRKYLLTISLALVLFSSLMIALAEKEPSTITINVNPVTVTVGSNITISGDISPAIAGVNVTIHYRPVNGTWAVLIEVQTDTDGHYTCVWKTLEVGTFELKSSWMGNELYEGAESAIKTVTVEEGEPSVSDYDPWCDINDDGKIDIKDIASVALKFGTTGTPINKTGLLLELQSRMWYKIESFSNISTDQWNWNWTVHETSGPWAEGGPPYALYKKLGDTVFLTYPSGPILVLTRVGPNMTYWCRTGGTGTGGPGGNKLLMSSGNLSLTFTDKDIPLTDEDNSYNGTRILVDSWQDLYILENISEDNYLWKGYVHQHFVSWAPEGSPA